MPPIAEYHNTGQQIRVTPEAAVAAGDVIAFGTGIAVYAADQEADRPVGAAVVGVFEFSKATGGGTALTRGTKVGFDTDNDRIVAAAGADLGAGQVWEDAGDDDEFVKVKIDNSAFVDISA